MKKTLTISTLLIFLLTLLPLVTSQEYLSNEYWNSKLSENIVPENELLLYLEANKKTPPGFLEGAHWEGLEESTLKSLYICSDLKICPTEFARVANWETVPAQLKVATLNALGLELYRTPTYTEDYFKKISFTAKNELSTKNLLISLTELQKLKLKLDITNTYVSFSDTRFFITTQENEDTYYKEQIKLEIPSSSVYIIDGVKIASPKSSNSMLMVKYIEKQTLDILYYPDSDMGAPILWSVKGKDIDLTNIKCENEQIGNTDYQNAVESYFLIDNQKFKCLDGSITNGYVERFCMKKQEGHASYFTPIDFYLGPRENELENDYKIYKEHCLLPRIEIKIENGNKSLYLSGQKGNSLELRKIQNLNEYVSFSFISVLTNNPYELMLYSSYNQEAKGKYLQEGKTLNFYQTEFSGDAVISSLEKTESPSGESSEPSVVYSYSLDKGNAKTTFGDKEFYLKGENNYFIKASITELDKESDKKISPICFEKLNLNKPSITINTNEYACKTYNLYDIPMFNTKFLLNKENKITSLEVSQIADGSKKGQELILQEKSIQGEGHEATTLNYQISDKALTAYMNIKSAENKVIALRAEDVSFALSNSGHSFRPLTYSPTVFIFDNSLKLEGTQSENTEELQNALQQTELLSTVPLSLTAPESSSQASKIRDAFSKKMAQSRLKRDEKKIYDYYLNKLNGLNSQPGLIALVYIDSNLQPHPIAGDLIMTYEYDGNKKTIESFMGKTESGKRVKDSEETVNKEEVSKEELREKIKNGQEQLITINSDVPQSIQEGIKLADVLIDEDQTSHEKEIKETTAKILTQETTNTQVSAEEEILVKEQIELPQKDKIEGLEKVTPPTFNIDNLIIPLGEIREMTQTELEQTINEEKSFDDLMENLEDEQISALEKISTNTIKIPQLYTEEGNSKKLREITINQNSILVQETTEETKEEITTTKAITTIAAPTKTIQEEINDQYFSMILKRSQATGENYDTLVAQWKANPSSVNPFSFIGNEQYPDYNKDLQTLNNLVSLKKSQTPQTKESLQSEINTLYFDILRKAAKFKGETYEQIKIAWKQNPNAVNPFNLPSQYRYGEYNKDAAKLNDLVKMRNNI